MKILLVNPNLTQAVTDRERRTRQRDPVPNSWLLPAASALK